MTCTGDPKDTGESGVMMPASGATAAALLALDKKASLINGFYCGWTCTLHTPFTGTMGAQDKVAGTGMSTTDDFYNGWHLEVDIDGTLGGTDQHTGTVTDYDGTGSGTAGTLIVVWDGSTPTTTTNTKFILTAPDPSRVGANGVESATITAYVSAATVTSCSRPLL